MKADRVFDGDLIRADLFQGDAPRLIVTFRQRIAAPGGFDTPRPTESFTRKGYAHLHLQSRWNDWYINAETLALEERLAELTAGRHRVVAMGFSMGGYAAFRFSRALNLLQVIAVSPQATIAPGEVPWERRYRREAEGFNPVLGDLECHARPHLGGALLVDPWRPADLAHARMIQSVFPGVRLCRLAGGGHPATTVLREGGQFGALQRQLFRGPPDPGAIVALHRGARRSSRSYAANRAEAIAAHAAHIAGTAARTARTTGTGGADTGPAQPSSGSGGPLDASPRSA